MRLKRILAASAALVLALNAAVSSAQQAPLSHPERMDTPEALAAQVMQRFSVAPPDEFKAVYPFQDGRDLVQWAVDHEMKRIAGTARVLQQHIDHAVLVLSGHVEFGNTGSETAAARGFSEVYEARRGAEDAWHLTRQIPLDTLGSFQMQTLDVTLEPGAGMHIVDTLAIQTRTSLGWAARLNHHADIASVQVNGQDAEYEFGGGLLWVDVPAGAQELVLTYRIDVARDSTTDANSGRFEEAYGHVRNQYFWHPFLWFDRGLTHFSITVRAPAAYHVATDLDQTETVEGDVRMVRAHTTEPTFALSLFYDRDWRPMTQQAGPFSFRLFATPDFAPSPDSLSAAFLHTYHVLNSRFGPPPGGSIAVVQGRAREGAGWLYRTNTAMATPRNGGSRMLRKEPYPRAWFGHEVAHGWTYPTGAAANFLREGWATYAEALLLNASYGSEVEANFWDMERNLYETRGLDGQASILDDPHNSGVAYYKGAWIFRMLEHVMGSEAFNEGLRAYMQIPPGEPAGIDEFTAALSGAAGHDMSPFLRPWLEETVIPDIRVQVREQNVTVTQHGPVFQLPLAVEVITTDGTVRRSMHLTTREDTLDVSDLAPVRGVRVDPDHRFLMKRHWGEAVRFELHAPGADEVLLTGDLTSEPIPAIRDDDRWMVAMLLTEGRYYWQWIVDGEHGDIEARTVHPVLPITSPHPR